MLAYFAQRLQHAAAQEQIGRKHQQRGQHPARGHGRQHEAIARLGHFVGVEQLAGAPEVERGDGARETSFQRVKDVLRMRLIAGHVALLQRGGQRMEPLADQRLEGVLDFFQAVGGAGRPSQALVVLVFGLGAVERSLGALQQARRLAAQALFDLHRLADRAHDRAIVRRRGATQAVERVLVAVDDAIHRVGDILGLLDSLQRVVADPQRQHAQGGADDQHEREERQHAQQAAAYRQVREELAHDRNHSLTASVERNDGRRAARGLTAVRTPLSPPAPSRRWSSASRCRPG